MSKTSFDDKNINVKDNPDMTLLKIFKYARVNGRSNYHHYKAQE